MNILMVHPHDLYSLSEPWTIRIKKLAYEFVQKGCSVKLVYFPLASTEANRKFIDNAVEVIPFDRQVGEGVFFRNIIRMIKLAEWSDIIHFQKCHYYAALPALIAAWIKNKPVHYDWDDWETKIFYYSNPKQIFVGEFINIFEKMIPRIVDTVSVSSKRLADLCVKAGVSHDNIFWAQVGADIRYFFPQDTSVNIKEQQNINNYLVLYVGQLHGGQYCELFIKAARTILDSMPRVTFMIVGDGYRRRELESLAVKLNVYNNFIFTGAVPHEKVHHYIAGADVCVACFEDNHITQCKSPLKIVEYLALGKAIVASNVGEVRSMLGGVGVLVEPGDPYSLAGGIMTVLRDKGLKMRLEKWTRERVIKRYNWSVTADSLLCAYRKSLYKGYILQKEVDKKSLRFLTACVVSVTKHDNAPYTIEFRKKTLFGNKIDSLTVEPLCTFYEYGIQTDPKSINIVKAGTTIQAAYIMHKGVKVAFAITVMLTKKMRL